MSVRVLWVIKGLGPGGAERLLCAAARAHQDRFDLHCVTVRADKTHLADELVRAGVDVTCTARSRRDPLALLRLLRVVRSGDWDVVHVHSPLVGSLARLTVRTLPAGRRPVVITTEHNTWASHRLLTRVLNRATSRLSDAVIAVDDSVRSSMRGRAADRAEVLTHGIDLTAARAHADGPAVRSELGIATDEFVVGTVANFRRNKDYPNLLRAIRLLGDRGVAVRLVAVGQGPDADAIADAARELDLDDVVFTGYRSDATRVMSAFDVFCLASRWEGLPVAAMEAAALGRPIVATRVGGLAAAFHDAASLVPPGDADALAGALATVVADDQRRGELAAASLRAADRFDVSVAVRRVEAVMDDLVDRPSDRRVHERTASANASDRGSLNTGLRDDVMIRRATMDDRTEVIALCRDALGWGDDPRFARLFAWKHDHNAFGPSPMWVATQRTRIVGMRAFMRWEFERDGDVLSAVRAVDTVTHRDMRGHGIFKALTAHAVDQLVDDGVDFVFNTPNSASLPGYLALGWRTVGRLPVDLAFRTPLSPVGLLRNRVGAEHWPVDHEAFVAASEPWEPGVGERLAQASQRVEHPMGQLRTRRSAAFYDWRYGLPDLGYRIIGSEHGDLVARMRRRGTRRELVLLDAPGVPPADADRLLRRLLRESGCDHSVRLGAASGPVGVLAVGAIGPLLTWRAVAPMAMPVLSAWDLSMGDVELL